jgi:glycosyltransferase involved in cell wall biosynthesis
VTTSLVSPTTAAGGSGPCRPRVCFVTTRAAWPLYPGYRLRTANLLRALSTLADVDAVFILPDDELSDPLPPDLAGLNVHVVPVPRLSVPKALLAWATSSRPMPMLKVDWAAATPTVAALCDPSRCDAVFATPSTAWDPVRHARVPVITDLDDLDDFKILHRLSEPGSYPAGWRGFAHRTMDRLEVRRWQRLYAEMKAHARCLVVCSEIDRSRLRAPNVRALPNVYPVPDRAATADRTSAARPSVLFVGDLTYRPNLEALAFLEQLMPRVWQARPDIEVDVVGKNEFTNRHGDPRLHVHGTVPDLDPFLDRATIVVAPLRSGGGTRIKILEAFAHRIPVVATTVGCEGLAVTHGEQLLIADSPEAFADEIIRLAGDPKLSVHLSAKGFALFEQSYTFTALVALLHEVMAFSAGETFGSDGSSSDA